jgi:hypothetical protein
MCILMSESFYDLSCICIFILGIQNLCCKAFKLIFTKDLVFGLDVKHVFNGVNFFQIQTSRWTKWDGTIKTIAYFLLSSSTLFQSWKESLYPG